MLITGAGRAFSAGIAELHVHNPRDFATDRYRKVDDEPYGGGAGMVMKPEPWGEAIDALIGEAESDVVLIIPSPAGEPFSQATARELAAEQHLVFACGRFVYGLHDDFDRVLLLNEDDVRPEAEDAEEQPARGIS